MVFSIKEIIEDPELPDIWIVLKNEQDINQYHSLHSLLYNIQFDTQN